MMFNLDKKPAKYSLIARSFVDIKKLLFNK